MNPSNRHEYFNHTWTWKDTRANTMDRIHFSQFGLHRKCSRWTNFISVHSGGKNSNDPKSDKRIWSLKYSTEQFWRTLPQSQGASLMILLNPFSISIRIHRILRDNIKTTVSVSQNIYVYILHIFWSMTFFIPFKPAFFGWLSLISAELFLMDL